jgi:predicted naringenin-chalcone synthase
MEGSWQLVNLFAGALNRPEFRFSEVLVPWIVIVGMLGFLTAWLVVAILERTGLSRYVWHLPLFFVGLVVLVSSLIGMVVFP